MKATTTVARNGEKGIADQVFSGYDPLLLKVNKYGPNIQVFATNRGRNIILLKRLIIRLGYAPGHTTYLYLRDEDFHVGGERIEPGSGQSKYRAPTKAKEAQVYGEYLEVPGRSQTPLVTF